MKLELTDVEKLILRECLKHAYITIDFDSFKCADGDYVRSVIVKLAADKEKPRW